jgi:hypothetical protein
VRRLLIVFVVTLASCASAGSWTKSPDATTCGDWVEVLDTDERTALATSLLAELWLRAGAPRTPDADTTRAFADGVGGVCRGTPGLSVAMAGARVLDSLAEVRAPGAPATAPPGARRPAREAPDEPLVGTARGVERVEIRLTEVEGRDSFFGAASNDIAPPDRMYLQLLVTYRALVDDVTIDPADWTLLASGVPAAEADVANAPVPKLAPSVLGRHETASGYLVFDVPIQGELVLLYDPGGTADPLEVTLREAPREF